MTIKEVENILDIPRATVRFYEKQGLINPNRGDNGYRDYTKEDIEQLKKIIIFRRIGVSVEDINDVFDGAKPLNEVLDRNVMNLYKQMEELKGAINLTQKIQEDHVEIAAMNTDLYWKTIEEEERQGNSFFDLAKDIAEVEKNVMKSYLGFTDINGKFYDSMPVLIRNNIIVVILTGCLLCLISGLWTVKNFLDGIVYIIGIILVEMMLSIPLYFLGKKYEWIKRNRTKALFVSAIILAALLIVVVNILK